MSGFPDQGRQRPALAGAKRSFAPAGPCSDTQAAFVRRPPANAAEGHQAQASAGERSQPRSRPALSAAAAWLRTRLITCGVGGRLAGNDPIHALAVRLLGLEPERELLAHHGGKKNPRTECGCQPVDVMIVAMVAPPGRRSSPSTRACFEFVRLVCWSPLRAAFGRALDEACAFAVCPRLRLDMPKLLSIVPAQHRAATT